MFQDPHGHQHQQQQQLGHQQHSSRQLQQQQDHHGGGGISGPVRPPIMHHVGKPPELYNNHNLQADQLDSHHSNKQKLCKGLKVFFS